MPRDRFSPYHALILGKLARGEKVTGTNNPKVQGAIKYLRSRGYIRRTGPKVNPQWEVLRERSYP